MGRVNMKGLNKYLKILQDLADDELVNEFLKEALRKVALVYLSRAIKLTPVDTGTLRRGWLLSEKEGTPDPSEIEEFVNNLSISKKGDNYQITLQNNISYAVYVNYGHSQEVGRFVPAIGKKLKKGWVDGQFFLEMTESYINKNKNKIFKKALDDFIKTRFSK